jgi:hypothetical protein
MLELEVELKQKEKENTGTTKTNNISFEKNGYLVLKNLCDPKDLYYPLPEERGQIKYWGKGTEDFLYFPVEQQVKGSLSRYWHPHYRQAHYNIRKKLENVLGTKLYNTYYYDRYYFPGQELTKHIDRDSCEISVTVHISNNLEGKDANWPIWIKTPDVYSDEDKTIVLSNGLEQSIILQPGDGMIYKGCERPHWRTSMPGKKRNIIRKILRKKSFYYHQIFFHYVLQNGQRAHYAGDMSS